MRKIPYLHIILFAATFLTTLIAGAFQKGIDIISSPARVIEGLPFAGTLMTILLCHELAHYIASKKHHTIATLPYFIPAPSFIGTFGAFIKMKSPIITRTALIDIGASGPIAGFIISVIASIAGLSMSVVTAIPKTADVIIFGDSLLFSFLAWIMFGSLPDHVDILLHPVAFAGWIGLFVTSMNLLPIGQLDGGHITYAVFGDKHKRISILLVSTLALLGISSILGFGGWEGWALWAAILLVLGIKHPPVIYWDMIDRRRKITALSSLVIFIITFIPSPFKML
ncbi:MAG: site-2 protease family protein [Nitrospirae bacterium]|nr:site-2 protease family protein [Nitrospirota bacterium]